MQIAMLIAAGGRFFGMAKLTGERLARAMASKQFRDGKFHNTSGATAGLEGPSGGVMLDFFFGRRKRVPKGPIPIVNPLEAWKTAPSSGLRVTWLGHSTLLLEIDGVRVLIDPVWCERASPVRFAGPKRFHAVPVFIEALPRLDAVLLSHDHHDHLCPSSVAALAKRRVPFVTSLGVGVHLERFGVHPSDITELDWGEDHAIATGALTITATPAQHFSGRGLFDRGTTLWSSFVLSTSKRRVFYSADTGPTAELADIGARFGPFDLCIIEIGAWHPAWGSIHLGPQRALDAFDQLGGGIFLPVHWATFDLALHPWDEPAETLVELAKGRGGRIITPLIGEPVEPSKVEGPNPWWRSVRRR
jgi:L-ascorbate metabolism protein UlaG (beta-lactamase superfamily)